jgi:isopentenyldiphosphate isomerase
VSVGEHLQPGESSEDGAHRGLGEELGITVDDLVALGEPRPMAQDYPELALHDYELQQAYRCVHTGPVAAAADEVSALRLIEPAALRAWSEAEPDAFTPGFHRDRIELGVF